MGFKRAWLVVMFLALNSILLFAGNSHAAQMGGAIQGTVVNVEPSWVSTLAGTAGTAGSLDGTGAGATLNQPMGITTDGTNLYVAEFANHIIRKIVISTGVVTTVAGTAGTAGSLDGTGAGASFNQPMGITTDGTNLYVADRTNHTIRKIVISTGVVTTVAGTAGTPGSADGTGAAARFNFPRNLTTDGTNLYVVDSVNNKIRQIVISTGVVTTLAGSGAAGSADGIGTAAQFNIPADITTDGTNLYVADATNNKIRQIVISTGVVTTLAGQGGAGYTDGASGTAQFNYPYGITTDGTNLYVVDGSANNTIRKVVISTGYVTTIAGTQGPGGATDGAAAKFNGPAAITTDGTNLFVADNGNHTIRKIEKGFVVTPSAGAGGTISPATPQTINSGSTMAFTVTPDAGYTASVGGTCGGNLVGATYTTNAITANCTVSATFTINTYTLTYNAGANGSITGTSPQTVNHGADGTAVTAVPAAGYHFVNWSDASTANPRTDTGVTGNVTVTAGFTLNTYTVTPSAGAGGSISPSTPQTVNSGATTVFTVTPDAGYTASVGGTCGGSLVGTTYTTNAITADCTVTASFTLNAYTVTPSAGTGGSISPSTPQTINHGSTTTFTVTPNAGYTASVGGTCGGTLVGTTYTTNAITANCTVVASFSQNTYTVTPSAGTGGSISPSTPPTINSGSTTTFTVTPNAGYTASVGGTCGGTLVGTTYTTNAITANCTVSATFTLNAYTVTPSAGAGGTISPSMPQTINHGSTTTFTVTPSAGYTASVGGTCGGALAGNSYTTSPVTASCTVVAGFTAVDTTPDPFSFTAQTGAALSSVATSNTITVSGINSAAATSIVGGSYSINGGAYTTAAGTVNNGQTVTVRQTSSASYSTLTAATLTIGGVNGVFDVTTQAAPAVITSYTAPSATGTGNITASFTGGGAGCGYTVSQYIPLVGHAGSAPAGISFPHGLFDFTTGGCTPGSTITMTITYPQALPAGTVYWKYGPTPTDGSYHWYQLPATISGNTATFSITDGGLGDDDLAANGTIVDQGGPGVGGAASIPTLSEWAMLILAGLLGLIGMNAARRRVAPRVLHKELPWS